MDEKIFLVEEIKDINLEIGAANLFLQRAENQDELKVILAKGEMAHFHVTKWKNFEGGNRLDHRSNPGKPSFGKHVCFHWGWKTESREYHGHGKTGIGSWSWKSKTEKHACKKSGDRMRRWKMSL